MPGSKDFINLDALINDELELHINSFLSQKECVPNVAKFFEIEIERAHDYRHRIPPSKTYFDNDIELQEYFYLGWDLAESGLESEQPKNLYLWGKATLLKIKEKYSGIELQDEYLQRLNALAIEEFISGASFAWYYHWLLNEFKKLEKCFHARPIITHRHIVGAYNYRHIHDPENVPYKSAPDWKKESKTHGTRKAALTLNKTSDNYKALEADELKIVIELLKEYPEPQKLAINDLSLLE